jgi:hypothetical protein
MQPTGGIRASLQRLRLLTVGAIPTVVPPDG